MKFIFGKKLGMSTIYDEKQGALNVTLVECVPNAITQIRTEEKDKYEAIQVGIKCYKSAKGGSASGGKEKKFKKLKEFKSEMGELKVGDEMKIDQFEIGEKVKVSGITKAKGFQGVVKRHGFKGSMKTHGHKHDLRAPGSIGATYPEHVIKGKNSAGESFVTDLPTVFRIGASAQCDKVSFLKFLPGRLLLSVEYAQGFNESLGNTKKPRLSLGAEYRIIPLIPLRTGLMVGGNDKVRWAFGFGLDFRVLTLDFASDNFGMLFSPKNFNVASFAFGLKIRI